MKLTLAEQLIEQVLDGNDVSDVVGILVEFRYQAKETDEIVTPRTARRGLAVITFPSYSYPRSGFEIMGVKPKSVIVGSTSSVDPGARFSGKRYTYKWDGRGFIRQKQYLYIDKGQYSRE